MQNLGHLIEELRKLKGDQNIVEIGYSNGKWNAINKTSCGYWNQDNYRDLLQKGHCWYCEVLVK